MTKFNTWREFINELPFEIGSNIRKFVLWEQRNEQRGKLKYINTWEFGYSCVRCVACKCYLGNKMIKNHKLNYRTIYKKEVVNKKNPTTDTIDDYACYECASCIDWDEIEQYYIV